MCGITYGRALKRASHAVCNVTYHGYGVGKAEDDISEDAEISSSSGTAFS